MKESSENIVCQIIKYRCDGQKEDHPDSKVSEISKTERKIERKASAEDKTLSNEELRKQKIKIWLNLLCLFFANGCVSFGRMYLVNATTSLITDASKAAIGQTMLSFAQFVGAIVFITPVAKLFKINILISVGLISSSMLILAFYYPTSAVYFTGSTISGIGLSVVLASSFGYGNTLAYWYHKITNRDLRTLMILTSGIIYASFSGGFLTGNLIFSAVFFPGVTNFTNTDRLSCGVEYCGQELNSTFLISFSDSNYRHLLITFTAVAVIGWILSFFLMDVGDKKNVTALETKSGRTLMKEVLMMAKNIPSLLLAFTSIMIGMQQALMMSDYTKAYITCSFGISNVGYVMMGYGATLIVTPLLFWPLVQLLGRVATLILGYVDTVAFYFMLLFWPIENYTVMTLFYLALILGISSSLFVSFSTATYALLFKKNINESQFLANFWRSFGLIVNFNTNMFLCTKVIIYLQIAVTTIAVLLLLILEGIINRQDQPRTIHRQNILRV